MKRKIKGRSDDGYYQPKEGEWVQLSLPPYKNFDACCGCGLVHRFQFKLLPITKGPGVKKGEVAIFRRMSIDTRATNTVRKQRAKKKEMRYCDGFYVIAVPVLKHKRKRK